MSFIRSPIFSRPAWGVKLASERADPARARRGFGGSGPRGRRSRPRGPRGGWLKLASDTDFFFDHVQMEMTEGGRHLHLMKSEFFDFPDELRQDCFAPVDTNTWALVVNSQSKHLDWTLAPAGVAFRLRRKTQLM